MTTHLNQIQNAIKKAGGAQSLATILHLSRPAVAQWAAGKRPVPREYIAAIEQATNGQIRCEDLCPGVTWNRDADGKPFSYTIRIEAANANA